MKKLLFLLTISFCFTFLACNKAKKEEEKKEENKTEEKKSEETSEKKDVNPATPMGKVNEVVKAGEIEHTITLVEKLDKIPAANAIPQFKSITKDMPADKDMVWYHLKGKITNKSKKASSANITAIVLMDKEDKEFKASTKVVKYVPGDKMLTSIQVQPDQTIEWEAYYSIPQKAEGLKARVSDLSFGMKDKAFIQIQ